MCGAGDTILVIFVSSVSLYVYQKGWNLVSVGEDLFCKKGGGMLDKTEELTG